MAAKKVPVKAYTTGKGKVVPAHNRTIKNGYDQPEISGAQRASAQQLAGDEPKKVDKIDYMDFSLDGKIFANMIIEKALFSRAHICGSSFRNTRIGQAEFEYSKCTGSSFNNMIVEKGFFSRFECVNSTFDNSNLEGSHFDEVDGENTSFIGAKMAGVSMVSASFNNCDFTNADFTNADFSDSQMRGSELRCVNFFGANMSRAEFSNTNLSGSNLTNVDLTDGNLCGSNLVGINWKDVTTEGIVLAGGGYHRPANYEKYSFKEVCEKFRLTDSRFEFMVLSGLVEVRDNKTLKKVERGFDPNQNHVPPWFIQNADHLILI